MDTLLELILATDEFDRSILLTLFLAVILSVIKAIVAAATVLVLAFSVAFFSEVKSAKLFRDAVKAVLDALESVPAFIWVLAAVSSLSSATFLTVTLIFSFAALPLAFNFISGVVGSIMKKPYYEAAIAAGGSDWALFRRHVVPNTVPGCMPLFLFLIGAAIAVYGAIGIFGFVNRQELDLGVFLLRGREQAALDPYLLSASVSCYLALFVVLRRLLKSFAD